MKTEPRNESAKLSLDSLSVGYSGKALISDITLSLKPGEILALIGPNGSGKTTILKSITRHLAAISGAVYIDKRDMRVMDGREVAGKLAVVFTDRVRPDLMTCREIASAGRYPYTGAFGLLTPHDRAVVDRALETVNALDIADCDFSAVSDGQRQRILLARAICQEPEIIVLDEPTSFLDVRHKIELLEILHAMASKERITVVMSLHEIDLACKISDKIVCVKGDRIAAYGTPDEIFTDEAIRSLYDIESGSYNALLGTIELSPPKGRLRCFVIGGGGYGIPYYRALQKRGVPFAAGILPGNDIDLAVARPLAQTTVQTPPFAPASEKEIEAAKRLIDSVGYVVDSGCPTGEFNRANAALAAYASEHGRTILHSMAELREAAL